MCAYQMNGDLKLELLKNNQPYDEVRWDNQQFYDQWDDLEWQFDKRL